MEPPSLARLQRNAVRLGEIARVLGRYGLAESFKGIKLEWVQNFFTGTRGERLQGLTTEGRIRLALAELGTTFIKMGQLLSTRPDLVGPSLAEELTSLQNNAPSDPPEVVRAILQQELARPVDELFAHVEPTPLASASIGQVHRAELKDGRTVVVKVQHPDIEENIRSDLEIMLGLAELAESYSTELRAYRPHAVLEEFRRVLLRELDFRRELRNLQEFRQRFRRDRTVRFPRPFPDLCSRRVLTIEMLHGVGIGDTEGLRSSEADLRELARRGANLFLTMIFRDGYYHADPHPGNLLVLPGNVVGVLDFGMVGRVSDRMRDTFTSMLLAMARGDGERVADLLIRVGVVPRDLDHDAFRTEVLDFVADYNPKSLDQFDLSGALQAVTDIIRRHHLILPGSMSLLLKVLIQLEGTSRSLDRSFNLAELLRPHARRIIRERYSPRRLYRRVRRTLIEWERLLTNTPGDLADILDRFRRGQFEIYLEHRRLESSVRQLVDGILTAALFLGSSLMLSTDVPPVLMGLSLPGALGVGSSLLLGIRLYWATMRNGNE